MGERIEPTRQRYAVTYRRYFWSIDRLFARKNGYKKSAYPIGRRNYI
nr:MAG TPA: hypothetical protein [Caudoviricetes sp.]